MQNNVSLQPKEELIHIFSDGTLEYVYCANDGELFQTLAATIEDARLACARWIVSR